MLGYLELAKRQEIMGYSVMQIGKLEMSRRVVSCGKEDLTEL